MNSKRTVYYFFIVMSLIIIIALTKTNNKDTKDTIVETDGNTLINYKKDSRERYIASLAIMNDISYEQADIIEKEELKNKTYDSSNILRKYKTIDKLAGTIVSSNYEQDVYLNVEVRYLWNSTTNSFISIDELGGKILYLKGKNNDSLSITGGDFNINNDDSICY